MAPASRKRQADYGNIGVVGRKTGATLKDTGARDEHGMPPIESIFSSPEKPRASSHKPTSSSNGKATENRTLSEEDMELTNNSGPEPTALFSARGSLPPRARSPIKTSIGSPRKSVGGSARKSAALSSPAPRLSNGTPSRITNQEEDLSTIVDIATESLAQSIEKSPPRQPLKRPTQSPPVMKPLKAKPTAKRGRKRIFDISPDEVEDPDLTKEDLAQTSTDLLPVQEDDEPLMNGDDSMDIPPDDDRDASQQIETEVFASQQKPAGKGKRGRPKAIKESRPANTTASKTNNMDKSTTQQPDHETSPLADSTTEEAPVKRRGRPVKNNTNTSKPPVYRDDPSDPVEIGPSKPAKRAKKDTSALPPASPSTKKHPPPSARDRNAPIASTKSLWSTTKLKPGRKPKPDSISAASPMPPPPRPSAANSSSLSDRSKPKPRSLQILRSTTPADTDGARFTRSGRTTIKPIEYWRGERIVYTQPSKAEGGRVSLPGIQEIVRAEDLPEVKRARTPRRERVGKKRGRKKGNAAAWMIGEGEDVWGDEEDSEAEDWELEAGMLEGECFPWDPREERGRGSEGVMEAVDLAIAPRGLALLRKAVKNQTFEYAKTITLPFFHSGMVDIPPRGEKRQKNSRKNHMVFWVFAGRVIVDVSGNEFSVGRGGMWQVPRGNTYSVSNPYNKPARIFFAQGCYMTEAEGAEWDEAEAERQRIVQEMDLKAEAESGGLEADADAGVEMSALEGDVKGDVDVEEGEEAERGGDGDGEGEEE